MTWQAKQHPNVPFDSTVKHVSSPCDMSAREAADDVANIVTA